MPASPRSSLSGVSFSLGLASFTADLLPVIVSKTAKAKADGTAVVSICPDCTIPTRVSQQYACTVHADHGPFAQGELAKALDAGNDKLVKVAAEAVTEARAADPDVFAKHADLAPYPADQIEQYTVPSGTTYRLRPGKGAEQSYALFLEVVADAKVAFLCEVTVKTVTKLCRLTAYNGAIHLVELARPEDVYEATSYAKPVDERLLTAAASLVEALVDDFDPEAFADKRTARMAALRAEVVPEEAAPKPKKSARTTADDLLAMLELSVKEAA